MCNTKCAKMQCNALTKAGVQCKSYAKHGCSMCSSHTRMQARMDACKAAKENATTDLNTKLAEAKAVVKALRAEKHALVQADKLRKQAKLAWYKETRVEMQAKLRSYGLLAAKGECWRQVRKYTDSAFDALSEKEQTALIDAAKK